MTWGSEVLIRGEQNQACIPLSRARGQESSRCLLENVVRKGRLGLWPSGASTFLLPSTAHPKCWRQHDVGNEAPAVIPLPVESPKDIHKALQACEWNTMLWSSA